MGQKGIIMNKTNLLVRYDKDLRLRITYPEAHKEITNDVVRIIHRAPGRNMVSFTFANERELHRVIHNELEYFRPLGQTVTWKVYEHDLLPSLKEQLISHGFTVDDKPTVVMVLDLKRTPTPSLKIPQADLRRIDNVDGLIDAILVLDKVWGGDNTWVNDRLGLHLQIPGYLSMYAAYVENQPAAIAWTHFPRGHFAKLSVGSTVTEHRRQGLYTNLLEAGIRDIRERGYRYAVVEANDMNRSIVERHGFQQLTTVQDYEWRGN